MENYNIDDVLKSIFNTEDGWKPSEKIPLIAKEIEQLKLELKTYLNNNDYDLAAIFNESKELYIESNYIVHQMKTCRKEIEEQTMVDILKSIENYMTVFREAECVCFALDIVFDAVQCGNLVKDFETGKEARSYTRAVEAVYDLLQYVELGTEGFKAMELYTNTKATGQLIMDSLLHDLYTEWEQLISWNCKPGSRKTVITITLNFEDNRFVADILCGLDKCKKLIEKVSEFSQFILKDVLTPLIFNDCFVFAETDELMTVTINHRANFKPPYDAVIANLRLFFTYLSNKLNVDFENKCTIMKMMGKEIATEFSDLLVKNCLIDTIPNNVNDLQTYGRITGEIESFQQLLTILNFYQDDKINILEYVNNIDVLFANKSSQYFLETARNIMIKDLSASMSIGVESVPEEGSSTDISAESLKVLDKVIPKSLFYFPRCMISKSAQELLDLVYMMMEQAVQCSDVVSKKLYNTTRLVFELYDAVVPYHHENYLQTIPQYVALFHNNCMYLAHNLQTFGDKWLVLMEGRDIDYPISFVELVHKLRELGCKHLALHMQHQRKQILDNIRSSDLNCIAAKDVLGENAEAAIRQCLRQLQLLKNVWIGVFPYNVFTRLMCTLLNMFCEELVHRVCSVEDISMEMGTQLVQIYTRVVHKAPQLLQDPADIETHVKSWVKLQELIFVLGGSLKDIENHWNDGTGPLAIHFRTEELRNLIKALFQNSQLRANLLSKIK